MILLLIISITFPATIISSYSIIYSSHSIAELMSEKMASQTVSNAEKITTFLDNVHRDVVYLSKAPPTQGIVRARENGGVDRLDNSTLQSWIERLKIVFMGTMEAKPYFSHLRYLDETGQELVNITQNGSITVVPDSELENKSNQYYFNEALKLGAGEIYVSRIDLAEENGQLVVPYIPVIRYATPIYNEKGEKRGMIIANVFADYFLNSVSSHTILTQSSEVLVINEEGYYLSHPDPAKRWGFVLNRSHNIKEDYDPLIFNQIINQRQGLIEDNKNLFTYYTIFPDKESQDNQLIVIYHASKSKIFRAINQSKWVAILITVGSLTLVLVVGIIMIQGLVKSISQLINVLSSFSVEVLSTVDEQDRMLAQQSSSVHETTMTMNQLSACSQQSLEQANATVMGAKQALTKGGDGAKAVEETLTEIGLLKENVTLIANQILQLSEQTQKIANISGLVTDLANQTNMLALNASVEAVRAGEQGKGFAVVATEIRRLAEYSKKSAQDINHIVSDIQTAISQTVIVSKEGTQKVESGVEIAQRTAMAFQEISAAIDQIVTNSQQIALNAKQQASATEEVVEAMNSLNQGAMEVSKGINQTKAGAQQLSETALNLQSMI